MASYTDIKDLHDDEKLAVALGNMMIAWAHGETILIGALARICGIDINMATHGYYRIPTFEARTKYLQALIHKWRPKRFDRSAISKEIAGISGLSRARNEWVHGLWCRENETGKIVVFNFRKQESDRQKPVKAADVQNHVNALDGRVNALAKLIKYSDLTDHSRPAPSN